MALLPIILTTIALLFSLLSSFWCQSYSFDSNRQRWPDWQFSLWNYRGTSFDQEAIDIIPNDNNNNNNNGILDNDNNEDEDYNDLFVGKCQGYPSSVDFDGYWKAARAFSIIAAIVGGFFWLALLMSPFIFPSKSTSWKTMGMMMLVLMPLFQGLTFLMFRSDVCSDPNNNRSILLDRFSKRDSSALQGYSGRDCQWDRGCTLNAVGIGLWVLAGLMMMLTKSPKHDSHHDHHHDVKHVDHDAVVVPHDRHVDHTSVNTTGSGPYGNSPMSHGTPDTTYNVTNPSHATVDVNKPTPVIVSNPV
jgi:hypothetical protein